MSAEILQPSIQDLQSDVVDLLEEISCLMKQASEIFGSEIKEEYIGFYEQTNEEIRKVRNLELVMAVVAPMKAGKSTIINAIRGQDLLPSRNAAMTTLPTRIVFTGEVQQPILTLGQDLQEFVRVAIIDLNKINVPNNPHGKKLNVNLSKNPSAHELNDLLKIIKDPNYLIPQEVEGSRQINEILTQLNDIVRLCGLSSLGNLKRKAQLLKEIPQIESPFSKFQQAKQPDSIGNLVIVDTPGPNEASQDNELDLMEIVRDQLEKCSIVLIILDYTQLNTEAANRVKKEIENIIEIKSKDSLYAVVNKIDQRRKGDMSSKQVREFVEAELGISGDRIFEVSGIRALLATKFLLELEQKPEAEISELETVESLAQETLGVDWEEELIQISKEGLKNKSEILWKKSGFEYFLENVIQVLIAEVAPRSIKSALDSTKNRFTKLEEEVRLRRNAGTGKATVLREQISNLQSDLNKVNNIRNTLQKASEVENEAAISLMQNIEELKKNAKFKLEDFFKKKQDTSWSEILTLGLFSELQKEFKFDQEDKARRFTSKAIDFAISETKREIERTRHQIETKIKQSIDKLYSILNTEIEPIIKDAQERLTKAFNIQLLFPPLPTSEVPDSLKIDRSIVSKGSEKVKVEEKRKVMKGVWWTLFLWKREVEEKYMIEKSIDIYVVSLKELTSTINNSIESTINDIGQSTSKYFKEDFKGRLNEYCNSVEDYLAGYKSSLNQALIDQQLEEDKKQELIQSLDRIILESQHIMKRIDSYLKYVEEWMKSKQSSEVSYIGFKGAH